MYIACLLSDSISVIFSVTHHVLGQVPVTGDAPENKESWQITKDAHN
jgi:hypothetical protein